MLKQREQEVAAKEERLRKISQEKEAKRQEHTKTVSEKIEQAHENKAKEEEELKKKTAEKLEQKLEIAEQNRLEMAEKAKKAKEEQVSVPKRAGGRSLAASAACHGRGRGASAADGFVSFPFLSFSSVLIRIFISFGLVLVCRFESAYRFIFMFLNYRNPNNTRYRFTVSKIFKNVPSPFYL